MKTILLAEDNEPIRRIVQRSLSRIDRQVIPAADGWEAWQEYILHRDRIDLVITDHDMPRMNGAQLIQEIRKDELKRTPIILMSAHDLGDNVRELYNVQDFLLKPFNINKLYELVNAHIGGYH